MYMRIGYRKCTRKGSEGCSTIYASDGICGGPNGNGGREGRRIRKTWLRRRLGTRLSRELRKYQLEVWRIIISWTIRGAPGTRHTLWRKCVAACLRSPRAPVA